MNISCKTLEHIIHSNFMDHLENLNILTDYQHGFRKRRSCETQLRQGTTAIVRKYRQLVRTLKQTWVEQVILSRILPVMGRRGHKYRNCRGMAINMLVQKLCREEEVGFVDLWGSFVGRAMYMKDGLHLSGKGAAVFADKLSAAVDSDLGTMTNIFGSKHSLN